MKCNCLFGEDLINMNILFLTLAYPINNQKNIYSDLMNEFVDRGCMFKFCCNKMKIIDAKNEKHTKINVYIMDDYNCKKEFNDLLCWVTLLLVLY